MTFLQSYCFSYTVIVIGKVPLKWLLFIKWNSLRFSLWREVKVFLFYQLFNWVMYLFYCTFFACLCDYWVIPLGLVFQENVFVDNRWCWQSFFNSMSYIFLCYDGVSSFNWIPPVTVHIGLNKLFLGSLTWSKQGCVSKRARIMWLLS